MKIKYEKLAWFEMKPNCYGGEYFDEHIPQWDGYYIGDKQGDVTTKELKFTPEDFAPGTKITIETPVCPKCGEVYENCMVRGYGQENECSFNWKEWVEIQYS